MVSKVAVKGTQAHKRGGVERREREGVSSEVHDALTAETVAIPERWWMEHWSSLLTAEDWAQFGQGTRPGHSLVPALGVVSEGHS